jgi:hypothetical protein
VVVFFSTTHTADANYVYIKNWLDQRGQPNVFYSAIIEDGLSNVDALTDLMEARAHAEQDSALNKPKKAHSTMSKLGLFDDVKAPEKDTAHAKKAPRYFIVFDDISNELRKTKSVQTLAKHMRHYGCKIVICSQSPKDIDPATAAQVDFWCIFKGFGEAAMEEVFDKLDFSGLDFPSFFKIYREVTKGDQHHFLYVDKVHTQLRMDFDQKIIYTPTK